MALVYPRVGGGNEYERYQALQSKGLSPRGRGKHIYLVKRRHIRRSIPAWAGETCRRSSRLILPRVYPRVGGGNNALPAGATPLTGLSPRGRGKLDRAPSDSQNLWSIPAWAGETRSADCKPHCDRVYPRVGGGNKVGAKVNGRQRGLSPRGRGKRVHCAA